MNWWARSDLQITIAADDDRHTPDNSGLVKATEAAVLASATLAVPRFPEGATGTDFNDMRKLLGGGMNDEASSIVEAINSAQEPGWPAPEPLVSEIESKPYPVDALPDLLRGAITIAYGPVLVRFSNTVAPMARRRAR